MVLRGMNSLDEKQRRAARRERQAIDKDKHQARLKRRRAPYQEEDESHEEFLLRRYGITKVMEEGDDDDA